MNPCIDHFLGHCLWHDQNFEVATNDRHAHGQSHAPPSSVVYRRKRHWQKEKDGEVDVGICEVIHDNNQERKSDPINRHDPRMSKQS